MGLIFPQEYNWKPQKWTPLYGKNERIQPHTPLFGIEIETEYNRKEKLPQLMKEWGNDLPHFSGANNRNVGNAVYPLQELTHMINELGFFAKRDGSLVEGFELVSQPFSQLWLAENMGNLTALLRKMATIGFNSYDTGTCGMHIHVNRDSFISPLHQWRFWLFFMDNYKFFHVLSKRDHASSAKYAGYYATPRKNLGTRIENVPREAHHEAIEMQHKKSIEVRIFRGTLNCKTIVNEILLVNAIREYTGCSSVASQSIEGFLNWLQETYRPVKPEEVGGKDYVVLFDQSENITTIKATLNKLNKEKAKGIQQVVSYGSPAAATPVKPEDHIDIPNSRWSKESRVLKPTLFPIKELTDGGIYRAERGHAVSIWHPDAMLVPPSYWVNNILHVWILKKVKTIELNRLEGAMWYTQSLASSDDFQEVLRGPVGRIVIDILSRKLTIPIVVNLFGNGFSLDYGKFDLATVYEMYRKERAESSHVAFRVSGIFDPHGTMLATVDKDQVLGADFQPLWAPNRVGNWSSGHDYFQERLAIRIGAAKYNIRYAKYLQHETEPRIAVTDREPIKKKNLHEKKDLTRLLFN